MLNEIDENSIYTIDNQFIPCINWFKISINTRYINFNVSEKWKKMSFGNRCILSGGNGLIQLSVPVEKGRDQNAIFKDIKISYLDNWQIKFWRTIISCYNRSPFFEYYAEQLRETLFKKHNFLRDLNDEIIDLVFTLLAVNKKISWINDNKPTHIDSGEHYLTPRTFQLNPEPVVYHQMFMDRQGFQANLSIIDLLFMEGPEALYLLSK